MILQDKRQVDAGIGHHNLAGVTCAVAVTVSSQLAELPPIDLAR